MKTGRTIYSLFAIMVLVVAVLACGDSNTGTKVGTSQPAPAAQKAQTYKAGDVVQVKDHTITLNEAKFQGDILRANFTIENKGKGDLSVSSILSFLAKDSDGTKLERQPSDCGTSNLDGKVLPGDKLRGDICWKGAAGTIKMYYEASFLSSGAIVWEVKK